MCHEQEIYYWRHRHNDANRARNNNTGNPCSGVSIWNKGGRREFSNRTKNSDGNPAKIATSGDNVYIAWGTNNTVHPEIMFRASTDGGKTFGEKINLSNTSNVDSVDREIAASGSNVFVAWWERGNQTNNEAVMKISTDNGKTFGPMLKLRLMEPLVAVVEDKEQHFLFLLFSRHLRLSVLPAASKFLLLVSTAFIVRSLINSCFLFCITFSSR